MALWTGCVLHKPELFNDFVHWENINKTSPIKNTNDFVLYGLLICSEEKIRVDF